MAWQHTYETWGHGPAIRSAQLRRNNPSRGWVANPPSQATIEARQREARYRRMPQCPTCFVANCERHT